MKTKHSQSLLYHVCQVDILNLYSVELTFVEYFEANTFPQLCIEACYACNCVYLIESWLRNVQRLSSVPLNKLPPSQISCGRIVFHRFN